MKKSKITAIAMVALLSMCMSMFSACSKPIDHEDAFKMLKENYESSIKYKIFYSKELISDNVNKEILRVNSVCSLDKDDNYAKNEEGIYIDHAINIYSEINSQTQYEIFVGLSKDGKKDSGRNLQFTKKFIGKNSDNKAQYDQTYTAMTPGEYIESTEFAPNTLAAKLSEINRIKREDIVFDSKETTRRGELTNLKFTISDEYYEEYLKEKGYDSILKGAYITMELLYGRIANITVMEEDRDAASFIGIPVYEAYKLEIIYLGPKVQNMPNYNEINSDTKQKVWTEVK